MAWKIMACAALAAALGGCDRPALGPLPSPDDPGYADAWIAQQVLLRLDRDPELRNYQFYVQSHESVAWIQGAVPSERLRSRAEQIAAKTPRVHGVRNNILVVGRAPPAEPGQPGQ